MIRKGMTQADHLQPIKRVWLGPFDSFVEIRYVTIADPREKSFKEVPP